MKKTVIADKLKDDKNLRALADDAAPILEEVLGSSVSLVEAEWDKTQDAQGRPLLILRISDWTGSASAALAPWELRQPRHLRSRLNRLWGDLLQARSHKLLKELQQANASAES